MRQRIAALGGVGVAALLGFLLLWGGLVTRPVSAMEKMAETIRRAKSLKATETEDDPNSNPSMPRVFAVMGTLFGSPQIRLTSTSRASSFRANHQGNDRRYVDLPRGKPSDLHRSQGKDLQKGV